MADDDQFWRLPVFVDDGFTITLKLGEDITGSDPIVVKLRPALGGATKAAQMNATAMHVEAFVAHRIQSWDVKDMKGEDVPLTPENVSRLAPGVVGYLYDCLSSGVFYKAEMLDPKPDAKSKEPMSPEEAAKN